MEREELRDHLIWRQSGTRPRGEVFRIIPSPPVERTPAILRHPVGAFQQTIADRCRLRDARCDAVDLVVPGATEHEQENGDGDFLPCGKVFAGLTPSNSTSQETCAAFCI